MHGVSLSIFVTCDVSSFRADTKGTQLDSRHATLHSQTGSKCFVSLRRASNVYIFLKSPLHLQMSSWIMYVWPKRSPNSSPVYVTTRKCARSTICHSMANSIVVRGPRREKSCRSHRLAWLCGSTLSGKHDGRINVFVRPDRSSCAIAHLCC